MNPSSQPQTKKETQHSKMARGARKQRSKGALNNNKKSKRLDETKVKSQAGLQKNGNGWVYPAQLETRWRCRMACTSWSARSTAAMLKQRDKMWRSAGGVESAVRSDWTSPPCLSSDSRESWDGRQRNEGERSKESRRQEKQAMESTRWW